LATPKFFLKSRQYCTRRLSRQVLSLHKKRNFEFPAHLGLYNILGSDASEKNMDEITIYLELRTAQELENEQLFIQFTHSEEKQANLQVDVEKRDRYYWIYHQYNLSNIEKKIMILNEFVSFGFLDFQTLLVLGPWQNLLSYRPRAESALIWASRDQVR